MKQQKKIWQPVIYALICLIAVLVLFYFYTTQNKARIQEQNRVYAEDAARQTVKSIESEFDNALQRIQNSAYLAGTGSGISEIDAGLLKNIERNTTFDSVQFIDENGLNLASGGETNDSSDRDFFIRGMQGESGLETVAESRITGKPMMVFFAPAYNGQEPVGVFLGLYFADDYLRDMLAASYFGEPAEVFLCTKDGMVIANSGSGTYGDNLFVSLTESGVIDSDTAKRAQSAFTEGRDAALLCNEGCETDNLCIMHLPNYPYVLVQAFPKDVTQTMVNRANRAGVLLEICLLILFMIYIAFLVISAGKQRRELETENKTIGDVLRGVNIMFSSRYLMVDL